MKTLILSGIFGLAVSAYAAGIGNADFEGKGGWRILGGEIRKGVGIDSSKALYFKCDVSGKGGRALQFIRVRKGGTYKLSYAVKADITTGPKQFKTGASSVVLFHRQKGQKPLVQHNPGVCATTDGWIRQEFTFTVPEEARAVELQLGLFNGYCGEVLFDDIRLEEVKTPPSEAGK